MSIESLIREDLAALERDVTRAASCRKDRRR